MKNNLRDSSNHLANLVDNHESLKQNTRKLKYAKFPYAVVEIKLLTGLSNPTWIQELIDEGILINKQKFSKFLSGIAIFNEDLILPKIID